jgi:prenylcysteine oxidase/farnesylcysteine lyase
LKDKTKREFDAVVVAAPLELADLKVAGARRLYRPSARQYQEVHVTLVAGRPSPAYFGLGPQQRMPTQVFASNSTKTPFCSMGVTGTSELGPLWKVFTAARPLSDETLKRMFSEVNAVTRFVWKGAYPVLTPETEGTPFLLAPGLYYANGFESAASTVELAAVAGYNVAGLALNQLRA